MRRKVSFHTHAVEEFNFGAARPGSGRSVVHLVLVNSGRVEARWGFQFPTDMHLEPEYWADSGSLDEVERHHHNVITNQLFTVSPKTGTLAPGESTSILCSFKHTHIGSSRLPVLLKVHLGREILLNWSGVTVERGVPRMFFTSHHHSFHPTPIGLSSYPIQTYEMYNAGEATVTYEVDTGPLEALSTANYLVPVLQCLAGQGEVPASRGCLSPLHLLSSGGQDLLRGGVYLLLYWGECSSDILWPGSGPTVSLSFLPSSTTSVSAPTSVSPTRLPGQTAGLSTEHLALGPLPLFSPTRRLVFLTNHHQTHTLSFSWLLTSAQPAAEVVSVYPGEGYVAPGKSYACRVTFYSQSSPAVYDLDVICKVVDETEMQGYQEKMEEWTRRQENKRHHFTISHHPPPPPPPPTTNTTQQTIPRQLSSNSDLRGSRYQVLPPIGAHPHDMSYKNGRSRTIYLIRSRHRPRQQKPSTDQSTL
ncbi:Cilia- and flagella-associated protein 65 [Geodia barretti]|uniref:Cilia- and flagella-associated protein 65 n=1 Tax=Geodia barretti TaxID=519541 RepID=A0AA35X304_GEOBA|nr:Cilia- and flagella-associated protein 65 [Geodia barretti]